MGNAARSERKNGGNPAFGRYAGPVIGRVSNLTLRAQARGLRWLDRAASRLRPARQPPEHLVTGTTGEREALLFLRSQGYTVVARRWTTGKLRGDLDLVAWYGDTLCFLEVKTRSGRNPLDPAEAAVDREKRRMLRQMASAYLRSFPRDRRDTLPIRFDIVSVYLAPGEPTIEVFPGAFGWRDHGGSRHSGVGV